MHTDLVAALDIGGTKIAGALVDGDGRILVRAQRPTPAREDGETVMRRRRGGARRADRLAAVGARGAPSGSAARARWTPPRARSARSTSPAGATSRWSSGSGRPTGGLPVELIGDGVAITAAEHWQGAARGHDNALCMVVSTGVGGGLVLGGKLHPGPTGNAGPHRPHQRRPRRRPVPVRRARLRRAHRQRPEHRPPRPGGRLAARPGRRHLGRRGGRRRARRATRSPSPPSSARPRRSPPGSPPPPPSSRSTSRSSAGEWRAPATCSSPRCAAPCATTPPCPSSSGLTVAPAVMGTDAGLVGAAAAAIALR